MLQFHMQQQVWAPTDDDSIELGQTATVYQIADPMTVDVLSICPPDPALRSHWLQWDVRPSEVEACIELHSPRPISPKMALSDDAIPVLCLVDALEGWSPKLGRVFHDKKSPKEYDARHLPRSRRYLQAVLMLRQLLAAGVTGFPSGLSNAWYELLMKEMKQLDPTMKAAACKRQLGLLSKEQDNLAVALEHFVRPPVPKKPRIENDPDVVGDVLGGAVGDDPTARGSTEDEQPAPQVEEEIVGGGLQRRFPDDILGCKVYVKAGVHRGQWNYFDRLEVCCPNREHPGCRRSRSVEMDADMFGARSAEFWLGAWLRASSMSAASHRTWKPSRDDIQAYIDSADCPDVS